MIKIFIVLGLLLINTSSYAQETFHDSQIKLNDGANNDSKLPFELIDKCTDFFKLLIKDQTDLAFTQLFKGSLVANRPETQKGLVEAYLRSIKAYGELKGFEIVNYELASSSFIRVRYLALHSEYPIRWVFTFYKSPIKGWIVINVKFDDDSQYIFLSE